MLYRTHHHNPFLFPFNPFSPSSSFQPLLQFSSLPPSQGMECVQGALKDGFGLEAPGKTAAFANEFWGVNGGVNGVTGDDRFVEELLDFSNAETEDQTPQPEETLETGLDGERTSSVSAEKQMPTAPENSVFSGKQEFGSFTETHLSSPVEGLESLEWLSHFAEDSFPDYSLAGKLLHNPAENQCQEMVMITVKEEPCFTTPVQTKARTKRARTGMRVWPVLSESSTSSTSSSTSSTTSFSPPNPWAIQGQTGDSVSKKQKKKPADAFFGGGGAAQPRRCSHCGVTKTPQWRAGPRGSKTLCNACGVRYKSGRLLPEYRPACSPTFSSELHSNNHRKVLEMRRQKEMEMEAGGLPPVQSF